MEVAEPEEGFLDGRAPVRGEDLGDVMAGGEVEGVVVSLEVGVEGGDVGGEEVGGRDHGAAAVGDDGGEGGGHGVAEEGEEGGAKGGDPLGVEVFEGAGVLLASDPSCKIRVRVRVWVDGKRNVGERERQRLVTCLI